MLGREDNLWLKKNALGNKLEEFKPKIRRLKGKIETKKIFFWLKRKGTLTHRKRKAEKEGLSPTTPCTAHKVLMKRKRGAAAAATAVAGVAAAGVAAATTHFLLLVTTYT